MTNKPHHSRLNRKIKQGFRYFLIVAAIAVTIAAVKQFHIRELLSTTLMWIDSLGYWKPVAFIILYNLATVLLIPGAILTLGGGVIFGVVWGSIYVFIAATLGATGAFLIGRYLSRDWVCRQLEKHPKFKAIDEAVTREGLKIVFLTRLSPLFPFNLLNYAFGVMQVSLKDYVLGSLGMIPGTIMYVYLGSVAGNIAAIATGDRPTNPQAEAVHLFVNIVGCLATIAVTIYVTRIAKKALDTKM